MKKARVLLIFPNILGTEGGINRIQPGMGIAFLAAALRKEGHEVFVRDTALEGWGNRVPSSDGFSVRIGESDEEIVKCIEDIRPDIVGVSLMFSNAVQFTKGLTKAIKSACPHIQIALGGNYATNAAKDYFYAIENNLRDSMLENLFVPGLMDENIDYVMVGESDREFPELVGCLMNGGDARKVGNLVYSDGTFPKFTYKAKPVDLGSLPIPAWDLFNMSKYFEIGAYQSPRTNARKILPIMATRGCPEKCSFCSTPETWGRAVRWREPKEIKREIIAAKQFFGGLDEVQIIDDSITANLERLYELCDVLEDEGLRWCTPNGTKANYHMPKQPEYYARMKRAGCYQITISVETGNQHVMDNCTGKRLKICEAAKAVENAKNAGLFVHTAWMVGFPGETREDMERSMYFAANVASDSYSVSIVSPLPGTRLYRVAVEKELFWPDVHGIESMRTNTSLIKADGFGSPLEFEGWVQGQNRMLNELLSKRDPDRYNSMEKLRDSKLRGVFLKQT